jgi:GNAT superfamily N-acetyltransferase
MSSSSNGYSIRALTAHGIRETADDLAALLLDGLESGAGLHFLAGVTHERAKQFWQTIADQTEQDRRTVLAAVHDRDGKVVGTVQMVPAAPENQPHRADIAKMIVLRSHQRKGLGRTLLLAAEAAAIEAGKTLLTLDTVTDSDAHRLYAALGWQAVGSIPNYALNPNGQLVAATVFYKTLNEDPSPQPSP